jgi:hypothetical protein
VGNSYLCAIYRIHICPHFIPFHFEPSELIDGAHVADIVAFVVVLFGLFGAEGEAANCFEEDGGCFEHFGCYSVSSLRLSSTSISIDGNLLQS